MRHIIGGFLALIFFVLVVLAARISGWSPLNLVFGPQYQAQTESGQNSRTSFVNETIPELYPKLVSSLQDGGSEKIRWKAQSGESQEQLVLLKEEGLEIETAIFTGSSPSEARSSMQKTFVKMRDADLDGVMDEITYTEPSGRAHKYEPPFDETSKLLWDSALAITLRFGKCCT